MQPTPSSKNSTLTKMNSPTPATPTPATATTPATDSFFRFWGDEYQKLADLGDGYWLIAHPNGPAICNADRISVIDGNADDSPQEWAELKRKAQRAFREWAWPRLKAGLTFPDFSKPAPTPSSPAHPA